MLAGAIGIAYVEYAREPRFRSWLYQATRIGRGESQ
jgi:hypothetical protein